MERSCSSSASRALSLPIVWSCASRRVVGEDLAHRACWWRVQVRASRLLDLLLEPTVERVRGGGELPEGSTDILAREVDDEQVALRGGLDGPDLFGQAEALLRRG